MFVIVNTQTGQVVDSKPTERGAKISLTRRLPQIVEAQKCVRSNLKVMHIEAYNVGFRRRVETTNLMTGEIVMIDANDRGGPCDPGTERYWTM